MPVADPIAGAGGRGPVRLAVNAVAMAAGGGASYLVNQAGAFASELADWDVVWYVSPHAADATRARAGHHRVVVPFSRRPRLVERLRWEQLSLPRLLAREQYDLLYGMGGIAAFRSPIPQLVLNHNPNHHAGRAEIGLSPVYVRSRLDRWAARASGPRARLVYLTEAYADAMVRDGMPAPAAIIPSGVAEDLPVMASARVLDRPEVLAVHNWYLHKRIEWLVETWLGDDRFAGWTLRLVGSAPNRSVARRVRAALEPGQTRVVVHEPMPRAELAGLFARASFYLSASVLEAFPLTPLEAMGAGVPCVLSDIPTHREVAGDAAVYFRPDDATSLVRALQVADAQRSRLVSIGHERALRYTWAANARAFRAEFESLLHDRTVTAPTAG